MSITVKQLHPLFAAEVSGIDLAKPLEAADRDAIEAAIDRHAVVVFHDQKLTDDQQIDFARHFGPIHSSAQKARHRGIKHRLARDEIADISNLDGDGAVLERDSRRRLDWLANRLWHTDASFRAVRARCRCSMPMSCRPRVATRNSPTCARPTTTCPRRPRNSSTA